MLNVESLSKSFKDIKAVQNVSFRIRQGEIVGLVGPNGAGKTTLIRSICTILNPDSGTIHIGGYNMYENPVAAKKMIAYIPEVPNPFDYLTVWEHIEFSARAYYRDRWNMDAERYLEMFNLQEKKFSLVHTLSKGQKQKMQIICAFIHNPRLIFMDEPLIGIDPEGAHTMKELIREFNARGTTFLISSHMLGLIDEICTSIMVMQEGKIIWQGSISEIKEKQSTENLEEAFIQITKTYRSSVEEAFEKEDQKPRLFNLFAGRRRKGGGKGGSRIE